MKHTQFNEYYMNDYKYANPTYIAFVIVSVHPTPPVLTVTPTNATVANGTTVTLMCTTTSTTSTGNVTYTFLDNNKELATVGPGENLTLTSTSPGHLDHYTCIATLKGVNSTASNVHTLKVVGESPLIMYLTVYK